MRRGPLRRLSTALALLAAAVAQGCTELAPPPLVLRPALVLDGTGAPPLRGHEIVLREGRIQAIGPAGAAPLGPDVVLRELPGHTAMPGLINAHLHFLLSGQCSADVPPSAGQIVRNLRVTLAEGVTTAADLGGPWEAVAAVRDWVEQRPTEGPRVLLAGPVLTAPGGYPFDWMPEEHAALGGAVGVESAAAGAELVADLAARGAALIKIAVVSRSFDGRPLPALSDEAVRAIAEAAHERGLRVLAHAVWAADWARLAVLPLDGFAHNALEPLPDDTIAAVAARGLAVVPTLVVWWAPVVRPQDPEFPAAAWASERIEPAIVDDIRRFGRALASDPGAPVVWGRLAVDRQVLLAASRASVANLARLRAAGAVIGVGTDAAVCGNLHGSPVGELEAMAAAGFTPMELLVAATHGSARALGIDAEVGTLEVGKRADLVVVAGDPLTDLQALRRVRAVVKAGRWVEPTVPAPTWLERARMAWALRGVIWRLVV